MAAKPVVLVVDDDELVRRLITEVLRDEYEVLLASDGAEAMRLYAGRSGPVAAVLTDVRMPRVDGAQFVNWLRRWDASMPVLVMSGSPADADVECALRQPGVVWMPKPFTVEELLARLGELVRPRPETGAARRAGERSG